MSDQRTCYTLPRVIEKAVPLEKFPFFGSRLGPPLPENEKVRKWEESEFLRECWYLMCNFNESLKSCGPYGLVSLAFLCKRHSHSVGPKALGFFFIVVNSYVV